MNTSKKVTTLLAAGIMAATAVTLAQSTTPPPAPPPPAPPMASAPAATMGGRNGAGPGAPAPIDQPDAAGFAAINKALIALLAKDPDAKAAMDAHPNWVPLQAQMARGAFPGGTANARGSNGRRGAGGGGGAGG